MKLTFLGTRGEIDARSPAHAMHSALLVAYRGRRVLVDCGADWRGRLQEIRVAAILLTHAHPDHAFGLRDGAPAPVYATADAWRTIGVFPIRQRRRVPPRERFALAGMAVEAFPVEHSIREPAVGFRIAAGRVAIFYAPDLVFIHDRTAALAGVRAYIGDGATLTRPLVRRRGDRLIGHTPVRTQLGWCRDEGVRLAVFTHCGSEIVRADPADVGRRLGELARDRGVEAMLARDGMELILR